jgi:hypothetical protein
MIAWLLLKRKIPALGIMPDNEQRRTTAATSKPGGSGARATIGALTTSFPQAR